MSLLSTKLSNVLERRFPVFWNHRRLRAEAPAVRERAASTLGEIGRRRSVKWLIGALADGQTIVRKAALTGLNKMPISEGERATAFIKALGHCDEEFRLWVVDLFVRSKLDSIRTLLLEVLADSGEAVRTRAETELLKIGTPVPTVVRGYVTALCHHPNQRASISGVLRRLGAQAAVGELQRALSQTPETITYTEQYGSWDPNEEGRLLYLSGSQDAPVYERDVCADNPVYLALKECIRELGAEATHNPGHQADG